MTKCQLYSQEKVDALFARPGMNWSTAFTIFVRQSLRDGGIPSRITLDHPNRETIAAMRKADQIAKDPAVKGHDDLDALPRNLEK